LNFWRLNIFPWNFFLYLIPTLWGYANFCSKIHVYVQNFQMRSVHLKKILGHLNYWNKTFFTSNVPYILKYIKSNPLQI
jgi:hypothetical protein